MFLEWCIFYPNQVRLVVDFVVAQRRVIHDASPKCRIHVPEWRKRDGLFAVANNKVV
jgi:hypothetical protein